MISQNFKNINGLFFIFYLTSALICGNILWQNPIALLAQLDRVSGYGPEGQGFESLTARHKKMRLHESVTLFFFCEIIKKENADKGFEQGGAENSPVDCFADAATSEARR